MKINILDLEDLNFVQIQPVQNNAPFNKLCQDSKYLESPVFSIFKNCFELSNPDFEYYSTNYFISSQVVALRNHLLTHLTRIQGIQHAEDLQTFVLHQISGIEFMNELKTLYKDWQIFWEVIRDKLVVINRELIALADMCIDEEKNIYVRGY